MKVMTEGMSGGNKRKINTVISIERGLIRRFQTSVIIKSDSPDWGAMGVPESPDSSIPSRDRGKVRRGRVKKISYPGMCQQEAIRRGFVRIEKRPEVEESTMGGMFTLGGPVPMGGMYGGPVPMGGKYGVPVPMGVKEGMGGKGMEREGVGELGVSEQCTPEKTGIANTGRLVSKSRGLRKKGGEDGNPERGVKRNLRTELEGPVTRGGKEGEGVVHNQDTAAGLIAESENRGPRPNWEEERGTLPVPD